MPTAVMVIAAVMAEAMVHPGEVVEEPLGLYVRRFWGEGLRRLFAILAEIFPAASVGSALSEWRTKVLWSSPRAPAQSISILGT